MKTKPYFYSSLWSTFLSIGSIFRCTFFSHEGKMTRWIKELQVYIFTNPSLRINRVISLLKSPIIGLDRLWLGLLLIPGKNTDVTLLQTGPESHTRINPGSGDSVNREDKSYMSWKLKKTSSPKVILLTITKRKNKRKKDAVQESNYIFTIGIRF